MISGVAIVIVSVRGRIALPKCRRLVVVDRPAEQRRVRLARRPSRPPGRGRPAWRRSSARRPVTSGSTAAISTPPMTRGRARTRDRDHPARRSRRGAARGRRVLGRVLGRRAPPAGRRPGARDELVGHRSPSGRASSRSWGARWLAAGLVERDAGHHQAEHVAGGVAGTMPTILPRYITAMRSASATTSSSSVDTMITGVPVSRSCTIRRCRNSIEPTSTPRVGWLAMNSCSGRDSSRATTTFCWLPPDSRPAGWLGALGADVVLLDPLRRRWPADRRGRRRRVAEARVEDQVEHEVLGDAELADEPVVRAVLGHEPDAGVEDLADRRARPAPALRA